MKLSKDGKCVAIALLLGERVTVVRDTLAAVVVGPDGKPHAFAVEPAEFDYLEEKGIIAIEESGCRLTGRGRVWAKRWQVEMWGHTPHTKAKAQVEKSVSRVRLRRANRRAR